ncbi:MAG: 23S rRNA (adenine(2503)-C(2))-methyltransferase RlmN [Lachnospiraceae bacterium]|nr:23S rRNA (adenine(2503)-C(2))-methyltransferase RlmN [Lachnospiraceae bacterium]
MREGRNLRSLLLEEISEWVVSKGEKPYRAKQIFEWLHKRTAGKTEEMNNVPKALREALENDFDCFCPREVKRQESRLDGTKKFLFELSDGDRIESVFMKYRSWNSVCISSQVGCNMGCAFCASTIGGLSRNLSAGEMLSQIYEIQRLLDEKVSRVVVMGSGEPLENFDELLRFIKLLTDSGGQGISMRNITVSTCGIVPRIYELAEERLSINLAISLHAATDEKRRSIIPVAKRFALKELIDSCRVYFEKTGRQLTFEYALIDGFNNTDDDVLALKGLLDGINCVINLIPVNPVMGKGFKEPGESRIKAFRSKLEKHALNVTVRREMGRDIDGACGQLRAKARR